jgi:hypothetical protein
VSAKAGYLLTGLGLFEQGDYFRIQNETNATVVSVFGQFIVNDTPQSIALNQPLNNFSSTSDYFASGGQIQTTTWSANNSVALNSVASATAKAQNILLAAVNSNSSLNLAFIEKKLMNFSVSTTPIADTTPVPVPGAFWLFGSALTGLLVSGRRKIAA